MPIRRSDCGCRTEYVEEHYAVTKMCRLHGDSIKTERLLDVA